jgi:WD40 repeat protein
VAFETALPQVSVPISVDNASRITELARYGSARIYGTYLSADKTRIFALTSEGVKVYQTDSQERLAWFPNAVPLTDPWGGNRWKLSASGNGERFALITGFRQAQVFDLQAGLIYTQTIHTMEAWAVISVDGQFLALPQDTGDSWVNRWQVMDIQTGSVAGDGIGRNAAFSPGGNYLTSESGYNVYIYRTTDWKEQTEIGLSGGGNETASSWVFSPDDRYLAIVMRNKITIWEVKNRQRVREVQSTGGDQAEISMVLFSEDGSQMAVWESFQRETSISIWNVADGNLISQKLLEEAGIPNYDQLRLDVNGWQAYQVPREGDGSDYHSPWWQGYQLAFNLSTESLTLADITGWDNQTKQYTYQACVFYFSTAKEPPCQRVTGPLGITSDGLGNFFSLWQDEADGKVALYSGLERTETPVVTFPADTHLIHVWAVSPDHNLFVYGLGSGDETLLVRDLVKNQVLLMEYTGGRIEQVQFTLDGLRMAVNVSNSKESRPQILVYDATQNAVLYRLPVRSMQRGSSAVLAPDGQRLAFYFRRSDSYRWSGIRVIDPLHLRKVAEFEDDGPSLGDPIAFSPDGTLLATLVDQGTVYLLDAATGNLISILEAHVDSVLNLAFSPDGRLLATSGADGFVRIWGIWP